MSILRYALYFSPSENHPLGEAAARWLGRSADGGASFPTPVVPGIAAHQVHGLTADPRRYGFHATLKAPFELSEGSTENDLLTALRQFAETTPAFDIPRIVLGQLGRFFALVPDAVHPPLQQFAATVVETFEPFRAALSEADLARRKPESLDEAHRANLFRWGYPYVMDEFRFHMTLTSQVPPDLAPAMSHELQQRFDTFTDMPLPIDGIALFVEPSRGADFTIHSWLPLSQRAEQRKTAP